MGSLQFYYRKRIRTSKGINFNHLLPHELVSDILSRLPLTSLPQVKLTCKLWNSLVVHDPSFPSKHLSHAVNNPGHLYTFDDHPNFHFAENQLDNNTIAISLPRQVENNDLGEDTLYSQKKLWFYKLEYASCHGLVCLFSIKRPSIYVFNPIIKEHVRLPDRPLRSLLRWGFGFAPITQKYKCYCHSAGKVDGKTRLFRSAVYTLGDNDSWRDICCPPYPETVARKHVCSKGALYWAIHNGDANDLFPEAKFESATIHVLSLDFQTKKCPERPIDVVLSLDLETEKFRERRIDLDQGTQIIDVAVVGEIVATVATLYNGLKIFFLIDEDKDIWEAKYTIPYRISMMYSPRMERFYHLDLKGLWMNQELYFSGRVKSSSSRQIFDLRCFLFSPGDNKFIPHRFLFPKDIHGEITPQLILPHVGSLVSPIKIMTAGKQADVK